MLFLVVAYIFLENSLNPILTFDLCFISLIAISSSSFERINDFFLFIFILSPHFSWFSLNMYIFCHHLNYSFLSVYEKILSKISGIFINSYFYHFNYSVSKFL